MEIDLGKAAQKSANASVKDTATPSEDHQSGTRPHGVPKTHKLATSGRQAGDDPTSKSRRT